MLSGSVFLVSGALTYLFLRGDNPDPADPPNWLSSMGLGLACAGVCWLLLQFSRRAEPAKLNIRPRLRFVDPAQQKAFLRQMRGVEPVTSDLEQLRAFALQTGSQSARSVTFAAGYLMFIAGMALSGTLDSLRVVLYSAVSVSFVVLLVNAKREADRAQRFLDATR